VRLQGSLYLGWRSSPRFPTHSWKDCQKEPPHASHRVRGGPRRKIGGDTNELGELVNELDKDCHEAQDQGYKFHFSWFLVLIAFFTWKILEGAAFPESEPSKPLVASFSTLWYTNDMFKEMEVEHDVPCLLSTTKGCY
jgi:hypothetical protein